MANVTYSIPNPGDWSAVSVAVRNIACRTTVIACATTFTFVPHAVEDITKVIFARKVNVNSGPFGPFSITVIAVVVLQPGKRSTVAVAVPHFPDWTSIPSVIMLIRNR
ncbi:MAG TPA: hypothetical protein EYM64_05105 [Phycisphaerales bacterium]|nr:hypothetical protein [Phycisphaerales bacterium]